MQYRPFGALQMIYFFYSRGIYEAKLETIVDVLVENKDGKIRKAARNLRDWIHKIRPDMQFLGALGIYGMVVSPAQLASQNNIQLAKIISKQISERNIWTTLVDDIENQSPRAQAAREILFFLKEHDYAASKKELMHIKLKDKLAKVDMGREFLVWFGFYDFDNKKIIREGRSEVRKKAQAAEKITRVEELEKFNPKGRPLDQDQNLWEAMPDKKTGLGKLTKKEKDLLTQFRQIEKISRKGVRSSQRDEEFYGPFIIANLNHVMQTLKYLKVKKGQKIIDLGHGEGNVLFAAATLFGLRGKGGELHPVLYERSVKIKDGLSAHGLIQANQVDLQRQNFNSMDWSEADYVYFFSHGGNVDREKLIRELKPGAKFILLGSPNSEKDKTTPYENFAVLLRNGWFTLERLPELRTWVFTRTAVPLAVPRKPAASVDFWLTEPNLIYVESIRYAIQWLKRMDFEKRLRIFYDKADDMEMMKKELSSTPGAERIIWTPQAESDNGRGQLIKIEKEIVSGGLYEPTKYISALWEPANSKELLNSYGLSEAPLVFANIREKEIGVVVQTVKKLMASDLKTPIVISPRQITDAAKIAEQLGGENIRMQSSKNSHQKKGVLILDTLGDQPRILRVSALAVYGNTLVDVGASHNMAEANGVLIGEASDPHPGTLSGASPSSALAAYMYRNKHAVVSVGRKPTPEKLASAIERILLTPGEVERLRENSLKARNYLHHITTHGLKRILEKHYLSFSLEARSEMRKEITNVGDLLESGGVGRGSATLGASFNEIFPAKKTKIGQLSPAETNLLYRVRKIEKEAQKGVRAKEKDEVFYGTFSPSNVKMIMRVLKYLHPIRGQKIIDLGHGEGSILFAAAALFTMRGEGGEMQSRLYERSVKAKQALAAHQFFLRSDIELKKQDFNKMDWSQADYIFFYSFGGTVDQEKLMREMKPGAKFILWGSANSRSDDVTGYADFSFLFENHAFTLERIPELRAWVFTRTSQPPVKFTGQSEADARSERLQAYFRSMQRSEQRTAKLTAQGGTIMISAQELADLSENHFDALYKFIYQRLELRLTVYGESASAEKRLQDLKGILGAARRVSVVLDEEAAFRKLKLGERSLLLEKKAGQNFRHLPVNTKRARTDGLPQEMALGFYALLEGDASLKVDQNGFYFDPAGWISGQIREFLVNQVIARSA